MSITNTDKAENIKNFFLENSLASGRFYNTTGDHNRSVDGSGWMPSASQDLSPILRDYICKKVALKNFTHIDFGTGLGFLPKAFGEIGIESYGVEGSKTLMTANAEHVKTEHAAELMGPHPGFVLSRDRILIADLSKKITDPRLHKAFTVSTSFEVIEHIHRLDQLNFWSNVVFMSQIHICAIHVKNEEHEFHCTINTPEIWENAFREMGMEVTRLDNFPLKTWDCSVFYMLKLPEKIPEKARPNFGSSSFGSGPLKSLLKKLRGWF